MTLKRWVSSSLKGHVLFFEAILGLPATIYGIVSNSNTLRRAQEITGIDKIYALVGGFHLPPAPDDYLANVMAELKKLELEHVMPMHCSGQNFIDLARREIPEKLILCGTGSSFTFTA